MTNYEKAQELKDKHDFSVRSCWQCNPAHEHLKKAIGLFTCYDCERWYMNGDYFNDNEPFCNLEYVQPL